MTTPNQSTGFKSHETIYSESGFFRADDASSLTETVLNVLSDRECWLEQRIN